jgi:hypothetical protein
LRNVVLNRDRFVQALIAERVDDRREGLLTHHARLVRHFDNRRLDVSAAVRNAFGDISPAVNLAALRPGALEGRLHLLASGMVDQRADQRPVRAIADWQPA